MKKFSLTSTLVALLTLPSFGQSASSINSSISVKEQEIVRLQKEIAALRAKLQTPATSSPKVAATGEYIIQTGDTVSSIARKHQMTASQLIALNNLADPSRIQIGQKLKIAEASPVPAKVRETPVSKPKTSSSSDYIIQRGDTFYSIARKHQMTVTQLRALNPDVKTHLINAGATLKISGTPAAPVASVKKVEKKPTQFRAETKRETPEIKTIATKKKATPSPAKESNDLGVAAKIKEPTPPTPEFSNKETVASSDPIPPKIEEPAEEKEDVKKATSVASIILTDEMTFDEFAKKHEVSTDQLNSLNGWSLPKATVLARGSEIYIPK